MVAASQEQSAREGQPSDVSWSWRERVGSSLPEGELNLHRQCNTPRSQAPAAREHLRRLRRFRQTVIANATSAGLRWGMFFPRSTANACARRISATKEEVPAPPASAVRWARRENPDPAGRCAADGHHDVWLLLCTSSHVFARQSIAPVERVIIWAVPGTSTVAHSVGNGKNERMPRCERLRSHRREGAGRSAQ